MSLVKSKQRVADHGEVFTPPGMVEAMLDLVKAEAERIDSRFLEPACGSGNFLVPVLQRKLATVEQRYGRERVRAPPRDCSHSCPSTASNCSPTTSQSAGEPARRSSRALGLGQPTSGPQRPAAVLERQHRPRRRALHDHADPAPSRSRSPSGPTSARAQYQRRDFRFDTLTQMSAFGAEDTLFADLGRHEIFTPVQDHGTLSVAEIAGGAAGMPEQVALQSCATATRTS